MQYRAINTRTGDQRQVIITLRHLHRVATEVEHDKCTGPCKCQVEPDGTCPKGWPSRSIVAGVI